MARPPYYPTSKVLIALPSHVPEDVGTTVDWLLATQRASGAWGQYAPTAEETALTLHALLKYHREVESLPREPLHRALFLDRLEQELAGAERAGRAAVLFIDLYNFKIINDSWGSTPFFLVEFIRFMARHTAERLTSKRGHCPQILAPL